MNEIALKNIELAEQALNTRFPQKLREFISELHDWEIEFENDTWLFRIVEGETYAPHENPIVYDSNNIRERWKIPVIVFADNGVGDHLVVIPTDGSDQPGEQIYRINSGKEIFEFYAEDIYSAYSGKFYPADINDLCVYKLNEDGSIARESVFGNFQSTDSERFFIDEYDRKKSLVEDLIDDEQTHRYQEILDILHELTTQPDYAARAWYKLSDLYFKGFGPLPKNLEQALEYNQHAVDLGHARSMANRAACYLAGMGLPKDIDKAYELIKAANDKTLRGKDKEKDGLYYEEMLAIKSEYMKAKKKK